MFWYFVLTFVLGFLAGVIFLEKPEWARVAFEWFKNLF